MKIAFYTLGCKVNQYETAMLEELFTSNGFEVVACDDSPDIFILNSCTVTAESDRKVRQVLRRFRRNNPTALIVLTGCFPQAFEGAAASMLEADVVTGSYNRVGVLSAVRRAISERSRVVEITPHQKNEAFEKMSLSKFGEHTRAFIKIEDGCDRYCSYCIIPTARGPVRSKGIDELYKEAVQMAKQYKEIVLVGINLGLYGRDLGISLANAVETVASINDIQRIRLGSLEPELLSDEELLRMAKTEKLCPSFHLSLQSGCDKTLKAMNRHYTCEEYLKIVEKIRNIFDNPSITTDIMVGFPAESDEDFNETLNFMDRVKFAKVHAFSYSPREGTVAAKHPYQIANEIKAARNRRLIKKAEILSLEYYSSMIDTVHEVLFETGENGSFSGYTKNYIPVTVLSNKDLCNKVKYVKITKATLNGCYGEII